MCNRFMLVVLEMQPCGFKSLLASLITFFYFSLDLVWLSNTCVLFLIVFTFWRTQTYFCNFG